MPNKKTPAAPDYRSLIAAREAASAALRDAQRTKGAGAHPDLEARLQAAEEALAAAAGLSRPELFTEIVNPAELAYQKARGVGVASRPWPPEFVDDLVSRLEARTV